MIPLILLIYNRPKKAKQMIRALREIKPKLLYVFLDGPKNEQEVHLIEQCRDLVVDGVDWTTPRLTCRSKNFGLAKSVVSAVYKVLTVHDRMVLLEDDCIPGPFFMNFMEMCLHKYEDVDNVMAATGYTVPIPQSIRDEYPWSVYFAHRIGSWGWGTWRRAWEKYERDLRVVYDKAIASNVDLSQCGKDAKRYIEGQLEDEKDTWTPNWLLALYLRNAYCVYPVVSHIQNIGFDGTGVHCGTSSSYDTPLATQVPTRFPDVPLDDASIMQNFRKWYR